MRASRSSTRPPRPPATPATVPAGHLRLTTSIDFGIEVMPEIVASFRAAYPQITVEMLNTDARLDLAANRIDLALRLGGAEETGYRAVVLATLSVGLYAAPAYLLRRPAPADLAGLDAPRPDPVPGSAGLGRPCPSRTGAAGPSGSS